MGVVDRFRICEPEEQIGEMRRSEPSMDLLRPSMCRSALAVLHPSCLISHIRSTSSRLNDTSEMDLICVRRRLDAALLPSNLPAQTHKSEYNSSLLRAKEMQKDKSVMMRDLAKVLLQVDALKVGPFEDSRGTMTPYYIDLKNIPSFRHAFDLAVECLNFSFEDLKNDFDCLCAVPLTGLVFASVLADRLRKPLVYPASSKEPEKGIRGFLPPGSEVLLVDDVSETGLSIRSAALAVRASGGEVRHALTLIDREEGALNVLKESDVELHSFATAKELAATLKDQMAISDEQEKAIES